MRSLNEIYTNTSPQYKKNTKFDYEASHDICVGLNRILTRKLWVAHDKALTQNVAQ